MTQKTNIKTGAQAPNFDAAFQESFQSLVLWRRDVRRFRKTPVDIALVKKLVELATYAPSVGNSQPWRFVFNGCENRRTKVKGSFERANQQALSGYVGEQKQAYANLKLDGLDRAPIHIAVFADEDTNVGFGLGAPDHA